MGLLKRDVSTVLMHSEQICIGPIKATEPFSRTKIRYDEFPHDHLLDQPASPGGLSVCVQPGKLAAMGAIVLLVGQNVWRPMADGNADGLVCDSVRRGQ